MIVAGIKEKLLYGLCNILSIVIVGGGRGCATGDNSGYKRVDGSIMNNNLYSVI